MSTLPVADASTIPDKVRRYVCPPMAAAVQLSELLCNAAGVPKTGVTAITCRVAVGELVTFTIEKHGTEFDLLKALDECQPPNQP